MLIRPALFSAGAALFGLLLLAPATFAADRERTPLNLEDGAETSAQAAGSAGGSLVRTIVGLAVVIGVIYGLYWVLKQVKAAREEKASGTGLHTLATLPLGGTRSLQLVRAGREIVLIGIGEHGVTPIRTYGEAEARMLGLLESEQDEIEPAPARPALPAPGKPSLRRALDDLRAKTVIR
jgi:flagellar protein FliO/FliZ